MACSIMETRSTNAACFLSSRTDTSSVLSASPELKPNLSASSGLPHPYRTGKGERGRGKTRKRREVRARHKNIPPPGVGGQRTGASELAISIY